MTICFLTAEVPNLRSGGVENVTYRLAQGFCEKGYIVHCLTLDSYDKDKIHNGEEKFICLSIGHNGDATKVVEDYIYDNKIDIIINQVVNVRWQIILNAIKSKFPSVRFIKVLHTDPSYLMNGIVDLEPLYYQSGELSRLLYALNPITFVRRYRRNKYARILYSEWIDFYDQVVLLSDKVVNDFKQIAGKRDASNVMAISNPVEFQITENSRKENILLYVGRLNKEAKRPDRLLAIWKKLSGQFPNWSLIFVGDGPIRSDMEKYCEQEAIARVEFTGRTDPMPYYKKASVCCITSTYEGFPLVCAESLSNCVVPIAFDSFGVAKDLIKDGFNGVLVKPYSIDAYCQALSRLMSDEEYLSGLRAYIREDIDFKNRFSMNTIMQQWFLLFNQLI